MPSTRSASVAPYARRRSGATLVVGPATRDFRPWLRLTVSPSRASPTGRPHGRPAASARIDPTFFTTTEPDLQAWVDEANALLPDSLPFVRDLREHPIVRLRPSQHTGRGVSLVDGVRVLAGAPLGLYFGSICRCPPTDEYALALPHLWDSGSRYDLVVDATEACRGRRPSPLNVAMYGHSCLDRTVSLSTVRLGVLPCTVAHATFDLRDGQALVWNFDGDLLGRSYTLDADERDELLGQGCHVIPCACRAPDPCPRTRWLRCFSP